MDNELTKRLFSGRDSLELTEEYRKFCDLFEKTNNNYFLTGYAGTGKSTLIDYFRLKTKKKVIVLAPTGLAAINVQGQTIHSFFKFPPRIITKEVVGNIRGDGRLYKEVDTIVIDEVSMVRADMLDGIDIFLRKFGRDKQLPFGGAQVILVGDPFQLPPVCNRDDQEVLSQLYDNPYFFTARSYSLGNFKRLELTKIFRQKESKFINVLNKIRQGSVSFEELGQINDRVTDEKTYGGVTLATTNGVVTAINRGELSKIREDEYKFKALVEGSFPVENTSLPAEVELALRVGARVMFVKNGQRWVNGTLGIVSRLSASRIEVKIDGGENVDVPLETWESVKYVYNEKKNTIEGLVLGSLTQFPIKLAWAITIHKSQGMTFDKVKIDYTKSPFTHGQTYVALSRCRSLAGISLTKRIYPNDVKVDGVVTEFIRQG